MVVIKRWKEAQDFHAQFPHWQEQLQQRLIPDRDVQEVVSDNLRLRESLLGLINRKEYA